MNRFKENKSKEKYFVAKVWCRLHECVEEGDALDEEGQRGVCTLGAAVVLLRVDERLDARYR